MADEERRIHNCDQRSPVLEFCHEALAKSVKLEQCGATSPGFVAGTSSVAWPIATLMARYLCSRPELVRGRSVVELGAGVGIVGSAAAALQVARRVILTDWEGALPLLERNREMLAEDSVEIHVGKLEWGCEEDQAALLKGNDGGFDLILASDVIIAGFYTDRLAASIVALAKRHPDTTVLIGFEFREELH
ncbi:unnamed protein product [Polarella glacialis]|uniref:Calmodulin-lysine N-methyltransferase n=1 Tax=Polarella glacialis TaxID=89957 RepID=A0A813KNV3_POLGL|nr:unnamed protein product [Polarella glacialis]